MTPKQIKHLRETMPGESAEGRKQALADRLAVSIYSVEDWEAGRRNPSKQALLLLELLRNAEA